MILKRFYDRALAQASYLVGCAASGTALVIDPNRDIAQYLAAAEEDGLAITAVTETHIHADFVSGSRELAARTHARLYLSDEGGTDWRYAFADADGAARLTDGDSFTIGNLKFDVLHTPGHTPEHLSFVLTDPLASDRPVGVFTGDFVFVGDVGRPDLLERAVKVSGSAEQGARSLFRSLQTFNAFPDYLQIWPGHGAGSACGKSLSAMPQSTIGYERLANWGFAYTDEAAFVAAVLAGQPEPPTYFADMKRINRAGPPILGSFPLPVRLPAADLPILLERGALMIDTRSAASFAAGHIRGMINIPLDQSFLTWAGWLIPSDRPFYLLIDERSPHAVAEAVRALALIGHEAITGYFGREAFDTWRASGRAMETITPITVTTLADLIAQKAMTILDVRGRSEWESGHIPGATNIPLGYLTDRLDQIPRTQPIVVQCQSGARSAIAASLLQAHGFTEVLNLIEGLDRWQGAGYPIEQIEGSGAAEAA